jgi:hypothetical protein
VTKRLKGIEVCAKSLAHQRAPGRRVAEIGRGHNPARFKRRGADVRNDRAPFVEAMVGSRRTCPPSTRAWEQRYGCRVWIGVLVVTAKQFQKRTRVTYAQWVRDKSILREVNDQYVEITTPYLDRHNDYTQIYVRKDDGGFVLTDGGDTIRASQRSESQSLLHWRDVRCRCEIGRAQCWWARRLGNAHTRLMVGLGNSMLPSNSVTNGAPSRLSTI